MEENALSQQEHWESTWAGIRLPKTIDTGRYTYWRFDELFREKLAGRDYRTFIEIGCAPASWPIYFSRRFGLEANGIEYTQAGYETSRKNMEMAGVKGTIVQGDFFKYDFGRRFDVVFSAGFVEHFEDTMAPLRKCYDILNDGGMLITIVPNLRKNIYASITGALDPGVLKMHKILGKGELAECYAKLGLKDVDARNFGTWNLSMAGYGRHKVVSKAASAVDEGIKIALKALRIKNESAAFSPYVAAFGIK